MFYIISKTTEINEKDFSHFSKRSSQAKTG